ncbi:hypothetical protein K502DRAFT_325170 [Neoconidiobolus thromboides FSU 785]|nr:hypothetical protein K502DRAFT_325170 [Neoconidiobolus thromboides FSU 785]
MSIKDFYGKIMSTTRLRRIFLSFIGISLWCIIVVPVINKMHDPYTRELKNLEPVYVSQGYTFSEHELEDNKPFSGVTLYLSFQSVEAPARKINLNARFRMLGDDYVDEFYTSNQNITCDLLYEKKIIIKGQPTNTVSFTIPIVYGTVRDYPLESYFGLFTAICLGSKKEALPLAIYVDESLVSHTPHVEIYLVKDDNEDYFLGTYNNPDAIAITIDLATPSSSQAFSFFLMAVMWGLVIPYGIITYDYVISRREVPPPLIAVGVSILFALPTVRNSQPSSPVMGCLADYIAFFWCIGIIAVCIMFNLFSYALRWRKPVSDLCK